jgi:Zn-dependent oligopeptidase
VTAVDVGGHQVPFFLTLPQVPHELGHGLSRLSQQGVTGESPSIFMQRWFELPGVLDRLARHPTGGQPLPPERLHLLIGLMRARRASYLRQLAFETELNLRLHSVDPAETAPQEVFQECLELYGLPQIEGDHRYLSMEHLASEGPVHLRYLQAELAVQTALAPFRNDAFNPALGRVWREVATAALQASTLSLEPLRSWMMD